MNAVHARELATLAIVFIIAGSWVWLMQGILHAAVGTLFPH